MRLRLFLLAAVASGLLVNQVSWAIWRDGVPELGASTCAAGPSIGATGRGPGSQFVFPFREGAPTLIPVCFEPRDDVVVVDSVAVVEGEVAAAESRPTAPFSPAHVDAAYAGYPLLRFRTCDALAAATADTDEPLGPAIVRRARVVYRYRDELRSQEVDLGARYVLQPPTPEDCPSPR